MRRLFSVMLGVLDCLRIRLIVLLLNILIGSYRFALRVRLVYDAFWWVLFVLICLLDLSGMCIVFLFL